MIKTKLKFLQLEDIHPSAVEALKQDGYHQTETHTHAPIGAELIKAIGNAHFVGLRSRTRLTEEVQSQAAKLTAIGCFCIGTNQVDLPAANGSSAEAASDAHIRSTTDVRGCHSIVLMA
ncbi:protein of unknown function [Georgfuchsia toluolica]|uniref:D-isomer specific 2-hydroxyacid dehydrogenase catalytic domain-containing protein n=1 Tax=Georgfuchsia toluolica TaxID=424218 RepID=A0A916N3H9_9PROT|nr:protein of unknown function [Georgfuchsia toluolica]